MPISDAALRIAQISDIHCGESTFDAGMLSTAIKKINDMEPDIVVVAGDLTGAGYQWEYEEAAQWIDEIKHPKIVIPGNHDARNVGYIHFENLFGDRFTRYRQAFDEERARLLGATGFTVVSVDSSEPDINDGRVGREYYRWITEQFDEPNDFKIFVIHHHLVPIPGTGRERNIILDAGDVLAVLTQLDIDVVLSGHKHVPYFWGVNGMLICNSSTASTKRVRGLTPQSWNELQIDASTIKCYTHYPDEKRALSLIFSLRTREMTREAFYLTEDFIDTNRLLQHDSRPIG